MTVHQVKTIENNGNISMHEETGLQKDLKKQKLKMQGNQPKDFKSVDRVSISYWRFIKSIAASTAEDQGLGEEAGASSWGPEVT